MVSCLLCSYKSRYRFYFQSANHTRICKSYPDSFANGQFTPTNQVRRYFQNKMKMLTDYLSNSYFAPCQFYFLGPLLKSFGMIIGSFVEYFFMSRINISVISGFESRVVDNFVTRRFITFIFSDLESLLEEYFLTRRFNMPIFSSLERLFFAVITHQP